MIEKPIARKGGLEPDDLHPCVQLGSGVAGLQRVSVMVYDHSSYISGKSCRAPSISPVSGFSRDVKTGLPYLQLQYPPMLDLPHFAQSSKYVHPIAALECSG